MLKRCLIAFVSMLCLQKDVVVAASSPTVQTTTNTQVKTTSRPGLNFDLAQASSDGSPVYVVYVNGIRTPGVEYINDLNLIKNFFVESGIQVAAVDGEHNPTGITLGLGDIFESILQDFIAHGSTDKTVVNHVIDKIKAIDENLSKSNPFGKKAKFLLIGHSQGTFFIEEIADKIQSANLPNNLADRVSILAVSPFTSYRHISMRKHYLLRQDDLPKAHTIAKLGSKGSPKPNLPPLSVLSMEETASQSSEHSVKISPQTIQISHTSVQSGMQSIGSFLQPCICGLEPDVADFSSTQV